MNVFQNAERYSQSQSKVLGPIEVPEWGDLDEDGNPLPDGTPAFVYFRIAKLYESEAITRFLRDENEGFAACLIMRCLNEDGTPMFKDAHKSNIRNWPRDVCLRVLNSLEVDVNKPDAHSPELQITNEELGN